MLVIIYSRGMQPIRVNPLLLCTFSQVQQMCINCGVCMGRYFCSKCKFFDDDVSILSHFIPKKSWVFSLMKFCITIFFICISSYQRNNSIVMNVESAGPNYSFNSLYSLFHFLLLYLQFISCILIAYVQ